MTAAAPSEQRAAELSGQRLAERYCGLCHAVSGKGPGPLAGAPAFADIFRQADDQRIDQLLSEGMLTPEKQPEEGGVRRHLRMPLIDLGIDQVNDLKAYVRTLRQPAAGRLI